MKIAIVGAASTKIFAPLKDLSWDIWSLSPKNISLPRIDVWFEMHCARMVEEQSSGWPGYEEFKRAQKVIYTHKGDEYPGAKAYPLDDIIQEFGRFFLTSSVAYAMALAIARNPEAIGLWGVEMSTDTEYRDQRPACHHFIQIAKSRGIEVIVPRESRLLVPPPIYGYE